MKFYEKKQNERIKIRLDDKLDRQSVVLRFGLINLELVNIKIASDKKKILHAINLTANKINIILSFSKPKIPSTARNL